ncbi:hypothetical protein M011DRAFT_174167 [Sporormia fimetaria CBS 119925]|uniref:Uncharacterized protein n=1 Tax=Sporormia fimetaria CBS 119925 TaxID=1340428 RepID=A0A6A6VN30_9PLEO|nr:hypothetical protein M011DRAFT_174167 [Sporormia fimetaria CBS 119925]
MTTMISWVARPALLSCFHRTRTGPFVAIYRRLESRRRQRHSHASRTGYPHSCGCAAAAADREASKTGVNRLRICLEFLSLRSRASGTSPSRPTTCPCSDCCRR